MRKYLLFVVIVALPALLLAQHNNTAIRGTTANGQGKTISLYRYSDAISHHEVLITDDVIDDDGAFELNFYSNYTEMVVVQIENYSQSFYIEPGRTYEVYLAHFDWDIDEKKNIYLAPEVLPLQFLNLKADELNISITRFDEVVDSFIYANRLHFDFKFRPNRAYYDTLVMTVDRLCPPTGNEYFERYRRYHLASIQCQIGYTSRKKIAQQYVEGQPVMYYDENYMTLFHSLYQNSISRGSRYLKIKTVALWVDNLNLANMLDSLGLDPLLRNEQVRELATIIALREAYDYPYYYHRDKVIGMLRLLADRTKFDEHRVMANNVADRLTSMTRGALLPDFELPDIDKKPLHLTDYRGKWVYLSFVRVGEPASQAELRTMAHFYDSIRQRCDNVEFITVCCDREFQKMYHFLRNTRHSNDYKWPWVHFDGSYSTLEQYQVVSYPSFLLVTPEGRLYSSVTKAPSSGILLHGPWEPKKQDEEKQFFLEQY